MKNHSVDVLPPNHHYYYYYYNYYYYYVTGMLVKLTKLYM